MKQHKELYFKNIDAEICYPLEHHINAAKQERLEEITLVRAELDKETKDLIYCKLYMDVCERNQCKKQLCEKYEANKSGRGKCINRGKLYTHGEIIKFKIS